ncbi:MAG: hypothetical protein KGL62_03990 [Bradyrhizobium sp.]|uniref:hypothetical protein n=1 Tax=Bradyrhizobium sp. TaxID=376 RepID=UPI00239EA2FA|nr:hypothetical protein [Bradyrhizobium sp.]MDE2601514.1 hypothetical protein [Bradyrhizobium sp.]
MRPHRGRRNLLSTCAAAWGAALQAAGEISVGTPWASDVCTTSQMFCHHPEYLARAAGVMLVLAIIAGLISAVS